LDSLGYIDHQLGRHGDAVAHYKESVALLRGVGDVYQLASTLEALGHSYQALDRPVDANAAWREAIELYQAQQRSAEVERLRRSLCAA
jgi:tetratricopeptide (TPR) repeat protein